MRFCCVAILLLLHVIATPTTYSDEPSTAETPGLSLFRDHVRTDLIHHCLDCHGGKSTKGNFDLVTREALMDSGFVGDSADDSYLMELVRHTEEPKMPFKKPKLSAEVIQRIGDWIDQGAPYDSPLTDVASEPKGPMVVTDQDRQFWSFQPLSKPHPPQVKNQAWCRTDIDRFIASALEEQGLTANPDADARTLTRRASFGLIGLPPTNPSDLANFDDASWENQIDELLASPHYGERWARHWMDVARFAESYGYEQDYDRPNAYHFRDFLIKAFNSDMPFDQFVQWQLAGDEFAPDDPLAKMATGFLGAGVFPTQLTEAEFESTRYDELDDMTATTGVAFLGLSVGCARCHDHKFDPIPTRDYYRLAATFTKTIRSEAEFDLEPKANAKRRRDFAEKTRQLTAALKDYEAGPLQTAFKTWIESGDEFATDDWIVLAPSRIESKGKYEAQPDNSILASGKSPKQDTITVYAKVPQQSLTALRIEALTHDSLPRNGPGRAPNGNFVLSNLTVAFEATETGKPESPGGATTAKKAAASQEARFSVAKATHQQNTGDLSVAASIDDNPTSGWAVDAGGIGKDSAAVFTFAQPLQPTESGLLKIEMHFDRPNAKHVLGRLRLSVTGLSEPPVIVGGAGLDAATVAAASAVKNGSQDPELLKATLRWFQTTQPTWTTLHKSLADHKAKGAGVKLTTVQINSENVPKLKHHANGRGYPHYYETTHLLDRGDVHQKQEVVTSGLLQVLNSDGADPSKWALEKPENATTEFTRSTLAKWLTDSNNVSGQLVARVIVNRVWQHHFGRGIVATPNDFGFQGERPTHPELLDWLAADLIEHGWQLKRLHKLIMLSSVYRQSSAFHHDRSKVDPDNKLLWRRTPRRLEAEAIRDSMLAVAGQLDQTMYGPGTLNANMKRRSIYFFVKRSKLIPMMMLFDWPEHLVSIGQRSTTTIAPQALMFMNSPQGRTYAEAFAAQLNADAPITDAYQRAFGRAPSDREAKLAEAFLTRQADVYREAKTAKAVETALSDLCQTLFSMNEFIYVD
ncbi:MAG: PSD1 and planctomycete cytochrome C domain-containing protein [Rubripirellula sp.]